MVPPEWCGRKLRHGETFDGGAYVHNIQPRTKRVGVTDLLGGARQKFVQGGAIPPAVDGNESFAMLESAPQQEQLEGEERTFGFDPRREACGQARRRGKPAFLIRRPLLRAAR